MRRRACWTRAECMEQWGDPLTLSAAMILQWTTRLVHTTTWCRLEPGRVVPCRRADRVWTWCAQERAANVGHRESVASRCHTCCHQGWHERHSSRRAAICLSALECRRRVDCYNSQPSKQRGCWLPSWQTHASWLVCSFEYGEVDCSNVQSTGQRASWVTSHRRTAHRGRARVTMAAPENHPRWVQMPLGCPHANTRAGPSSDGSATNSWTPSSRRSQWRMLPANWHTLQYRRADMSDTRGRQYSAVSTARVCTAPSIERRVSAAAVSRAPQLIITNYLR